MPAPKKAHPADGIAKAFGKASGVGRAFKARLASGIAKASGKANGVGRRFSSGAGSAIAAGKAIGCLKAVDKITVGGTPLTATGSPLTI
jgi:hypothetical protein